MAPIKSPRQVYKIDVIKVGEGPAGTGGAPIYLKMKESVGDWLGLEPLSYDAPDWIGTFQGDGPNAGFKYRKNIGGFRVASFKLVAKTVFTITQLVSTEDGNYVPTPGNFKTVSIGFPKGWSVTEVVNWLSTFDNIETMKAIITPSGRRISLTPITG